MKRLFRKKSIPDAPSREEQEDLDEKRKHPRLSMCELTYLYPINRPPFQGKILDISLGGVRLETREKIEIGTHMGFVLYNRGVIVKILVTTRWESKEASDYIYGAEFESFDPREKEYIMQYIHDMNK